MKKYQNQRTKFQNVQLFIKKISKSLNFQDKSTITVFVTVIVSDLKSTKVTEKVPLAVTVTNMKNGKISLQKIPQKNEEKLSSKQKNTNLMRNMVKNCNLATNIVIIVSRQLLFF